MKTLSRLFSLLLLLSFSATAFAWTDVPSTHPHLVPMEALSEQGIMKGYPDGTFQPDKKITRAEALKVILAVAGQNKGTSQSASAFPDVPTDAWYFNTIGLALDKEIVFGYSDGSFKPEKTVNKAEAMKLLSRAFSVEVEAQGEHPPIVDVPTDAWYYPYAVFASSMHISQVDAEAKWNPGRELSRAELAALAYRMQEVRQKSSAYDERPLWRKILFDDLEVTISIPDGWSYETGSLSAIWKLDEKDGSSLLEPGSNGVRMLLSKIEDHNNVPTTGKVYKVNKELWLHVEAQTFDGPYAPYGEDKIDFILETIKYTPQASGSELNVEEVLSEIRSTVNVDGQGAKAKALVDDWKLIETDTLGVGTGPVDYFYSPSLNYTIKYERSLDVILNLKTGSTSAF